jgi:Skp family chaperone for outer membrane proteins
MPAGSDMDEINYEQMAQEPGGSRRLDQEFQKHNRDLKRIENEISTLENNMEFLSRSKTADKLKDNIEKQISRLRERMDELQGKIKTIRQYKS